MIDSIVGAPYETADAVVIGIPYEHTASFKSGAAKAPEKIKEVLDEQIELFDRFSKTVPCFDYAYGFHTLTQVAGMEPEQMVKETHDFLLDEKRFFILLGGVHSISIGAFTALAERYDPKEVTIVQIDAHFDLRDDDSEYNETDPNKYAHSTVMRRGHELGYNLLPIGIRTMYEGEYDYVQKHNIPYFEWGRLDVEIPKIEEIIKAIKTEKVYLTIDVDGFDPSVFPGTGTPVPGGLSWVYGQALIRRVMEEKEVIAADINEVAPMDDTPINEVAAGTLTYDMLSSHSLKKHVDI